MDHRGYVAKHTQQLRLHLSREEQLVGHIVESHVSGEGSTVAILEVAISSGCPT